MSVDVQSVGNRENFSVRSPQFDDRLSTPRSMSRRTSTPSKSPRHKDKHSDRDSGNEKGLKSASDYDSDDYEDDFEDDRATTYRAKRKASSRESSARSPKPSSPTDRSPKRHTKAPSIASSRVGKNPRTKFKKRRSFNSEISYAASHRESKKYGMKPKHRSAGPKGKSVIDSAVFDMNFQKEQELRNELNFLKKELRKEKEENRTMHVIQVRHEKNLKSLHGKHDELPQMLQKHAAEVKTLQQIAKKLHDSCYQKDGKIHDQDKRILKLEDECKKYRQLAESKGMPEKSDLQKKLSKVEKDAEKVENENSKLKRQLNLQEKTHVRSLKEQKDKVRDMQSKLKEMEERYNCERERVKTLTRLVNNTNLYSNQLARLEKDREKETPNALPEAEKMPALPAPRKKKGKGATADEQANIVENVDKKPDSIFLTAQTASDTGSDVEKPKQNNEETLSITDGTEQGTAPTNVVSDEATKNKEDDFDRALREEDERLRKEREEAEKMKKEEDERLERQRVEREAQWREDSAKRLQKENEAKKEQERLAKEEELRRIKEEELRQAVAAREAKEAEERRRAEQDVNKNDTFVEDEESRRKKDALLNRLKNIDNNTNSLKDDEDVFNNNRKTKPIVNNNSIFGSDNSVKEDDNLFGSNKREVKPLGDSDDFFGSNNRRIQSPSTIKSPPIKSPPNRSFNHRDADKNLHEGKPTNGRLASPRGLNDPPRPVPSPPASPDLFGVPGYKPTLIPRGNLRKKPNNLSWLNDTPSGNTKQQDDDLFGDNSKKKVVRGRRGAEDDMFGGIGKPKNENKTTFLDDDLGNNNNFGSGNMASSNVFSTPNDPLLPRRKAKQGFSTTSSSHFDDNLDDGIEELTL